LFAAYSEPLTDIRFSVNNDFFITSGDKNIRLFHNVPGYMEQVREYKKQLEDKSISKASKDRMSNQMQAIDEKMKTVKDKKDKKKTD